MHSTIKPTDFEVANFDAVNHQRLKVRPMYHELGFSSVPHVYGRRGVLDRILTALAAIPQNLGVVVWDVYRPREVQGRLFEWMRGEIRKAQPSLSDDENFAETRKYMSPPLKVGDEYCAPHLSGGAIDLTLFDCATAREIEMGTIFDDCTERAHRDYFENLGARDPESTPVRDNRRLLRVAMESVGFTSYEYEWWHFDVGNVFWATVTGQDAVFGPLFGDQEWPR